MTTIQRVNETLAALANETDPYYRTVEKNLQDGLAVYLNAETNLDTILEDSINKLNNPPPTAPPSWWSRVTGVK